MDEVEVRKNITLYKWFVISAEPLFWGPTLILCLQRLGKMSLSEVYIMEAIVISGIVFLEIPSGALADLIGRKQTILLGNYFFLASSIPLVIASVTSLAFPRPYPTTPFPSPTTTIAEKLNRRPPLTTLATRFIATTFSLRSMSLARTIFMFDCDIYLLKF